MSITFSGYGNSTVGITKADGSFESKGTYTKCKDAWDAAKTLGEGATIRLDGAWLADSMYELESGKTVTLDLNGFPIIRTLKKTTKNGGVFKVSGVSLRFFVDSITTDAPTIPATRPPIRIWYFRTE